MFTVSASSPTVCKFQVKPGISPKKYLYHDACFPFNLITVKPSNKDTVVKISSNIHYLIPSVSLLDAWLHVPCSPGHKNQLQLQIFVWSIPTVYSIAIGFFQTALFNLNSNFLISPALSICSLWVYINATIHTLVQPSHPLS